MGGYEGNVSVKTRLLVDMGMQRERARREDKCCFGKGDV
jgi:hypothetical protein